jgi:hypothetical protein
MQLVNVINSKLLNKRKLSMISAGKYYKRKKNARVLEVPLYHALVATEAHLRGLNIINDNEDINLEFTPDMVRINITKETGKGRTRTQDG